MALHRHYLGIDSATLIFPNQIREIYSVESEASFGPSKLVGPPECAGFLIQQVYIGDKPQLKKEILGTSIVVGGESPPFDIEWAKVLRLQKVRFTVQNVSAEPLRFKAAIMGPTSV